MEQFETREMEFRLVDAATREVAGIAVPYEQVSNGEMFARDSVSLDPEAKLMWQHDKAEPIGKIIEGRHTPDGFEIRANISETQRGNDAYTLLKDGVVNRFSVGFVMRDATVDENRTRVVTDAYVREVSLVSFPWYEGATVTEVRDEPEQEVPATAEQKGEIVEEIRDLTPELAEVRERIEMVEREIADLGKDEAPAEPEIRSAGELLKGLATGDEIAQRVYSGATSADSVTTPVFKDLARIVAAVNPLSGVFAQGALPATGNTLEFAVISSNSITAGDQGGEGNDLPYGELVLDTDTAAVSTYGGFFQLTKQAIQRSTVNYLDKAVQSQARALGVALHSALRDEYLSVHAAQVTAGNTVVVPATGATFDDWLGAITDASLKGEVIGYPVETLLVSKDVFKGLMALQGTDGRPVLLVTGAGVNNVGTINPTGVRGSIAGIEVRVDSGLADDECAFVNSAAIVAYSNGVAQLTDSSAINLSDVYSMYQYAAFAAEVPSAIIPVVFD